MRRSSASTGTYLGSYSSSVYNSSFDTTSGVYGIEAIGQETGNGHANQTQGVYGLAIYSGATATSTGSSLYGGRFQSQIKTSGGAVTHVIGVKIDSPSLAAGTSASSTYDLYLQDLDNGNNLGTVNGPGSASLLIEGPGADNAIAFNGAGASGPNAKIYSSAVNQLNIEASANLLLNTLGGNVGIGTTTPATRLTVDSTPADALLTAHHGALLVEPTTASGDVNSLEIGLSTSNPFGAYIQTTDSRLNGTTYPLALNPLGGNVGIGTSSPSSALTISGSGGLNLIKLARTGSSPLNAYLGTQNGRFQLLSDNGIELGKDTSDSGTITVQVEITSAGKVGIATTTPWRTLSVTGTVGFDGLTTDTADSKTLCLTANNEVVANAGTSCITSSQRFKNTIEPLATSSSLDEVLQLNPVSFQYNSDIGIPGTQVGFIAEQVQHIDPRLVVLDASGAPFTVRYENLTAVLAKATQDIASITGAFKDALIAWLGNAGNGIGDLFATTIHADNGDFNQVNTQTLCVKKSDGTPVCINGDQLAAVLGGVSAASGSTPPQGSGSSGTTTTDTTPPTITITGNNPASIHVGDSYADLGASVSDNVDQNLGLKYFLNGALISNIVIDTSAVATDTIDYVATDTGGNTATSTRSVIVEAATSTSQYMSEPKFEIRGRVQTAQIDVARPVSAADRCRDRHPRHQ